MGIAGKRATLAGGIVDFRSRSARRDATKRGDNMMVVMAFYYPSLAAANGSAQFVLWPKT